MKKTVKKVLVVRLHHEMASAISTQNIGIIACNFEEAPFVLNPGEIENKLISSPKVIRNQTILDGFRNAYSLYKLLRTEKPDIVHVNALQDLFFAFIAVRISAITGNMPPIVTLSRSPHTWENPLKSRLTAKFIQYFSNGYVCLSKYHMNLLLQFGVPSDKLSFIPNPYSPDQFRQTYKTSTKSSINQRKSQRITYVAHICERKAQDVLLNAASLVIKQHPDVTFDLIGKILPGEESYAENLNHLVSRLNLNTSVHFIGELPHSEVIKSLQNSDIFVFPTYSEMMPRAVIEAMLAGKPVISSAVDGIMDLIEDKKTGILVQAGNFKELASKICELIENPSMADALGAAGQEYVKEFCSPERVGRLLINFYETILNKA